MKQASKPKKAPPAAKAIQPEHWRVGYARVSTEDQNLDLQRDALHKAGCRDIYQEKASGASKERPELANLLRALHAGDTLVVWRLDRLGRSLADLVAIVEGLRERGVFFESITERIDTTTATGELVFHIFASLAQFERALVRERTMAGLKAARARGRKGGRVAKLDAKAVKQIQVLLKDPSVTVQDVAKRFGVTRGTIYNHLNKAGAKPAGGKP